MLVCYKCRSAIDESIYQKASINYLSVTHTTGAVFGEDLAKATVNPLAHRTNMELCN
jgi:hypothetical protein